MHEALARDTEPPVALLLGGAGAGASSLLAALSERDPVVRAEVGRCIGILETHVGVEAGAVVLGDGDVPVLPAASAEQISTFVFELAIARRLLHAGLPVGALAGYSVGEQVAACLAGVFAVEDVLALMATEARRAHRLPRGGMIAVPLPEHDCAALLRPGVWLAAVETPRLCVLSGLAPVVDAIIRELRAVNVTALRLPSRHPFHTPLVGELAPETVATLRRLVLRRPRLPLVSSVTGTWMTDDAVSPEYWASRRTRTIRFGAALRTLADDPRRFYVDVSEGATLAPLLLENARGQPGLADRIVSVVGRDGGMPRIRPVDAVVGAWRAATDRLRA